MGGLPDFLLTYIFQEVPQKQRQKKTLILASNIQSFMSSSWQELFSFECVWDMVEMRKV